MTLATHLHKARGLGSAKSGAHHWIAQRISAIALFPLGLWFIYSFIILVAAPYEYVRQWLTSPWTTACSILFIFCMLYHGYLGLKVILEDYIPQAFGRWVLIIMTKLFSAIMGVLATISILKIFLS